MYFYVDESGHSGPVLFDKNQPIFYYGIVSGAVDIDHAAEETMQRLRDKVGHDRLHANVLGNKGLSLIADDIKLLHKKLDYRFDFCQVMKPDHAIISFFDQVFDAGLNPAITWAGYWTPLRYVLLLKLATIFTEDDAKKAWDARLCLDTAVANKMVTEVCLSLLLRVKFLPDARSRELIGDTLLWAAENPGELHYNVKRKRDLATIMPNGIGFQAAVFLMAARSREADKQATKVIVDRQSQFNQAQRALLKFYADVREIDVEMGPGLPKWDLRNTPTVPIEVAKSAHSAGLELVDIHLWAFKRMLEGRLPAELHEKLVSPFVEETRYDEISLDAIANRWEPWFANLEEPTAEMRAASKDVFLPDEERRKKVVATVRTKVDFKRPF